MSFDGNRIVGTKKARLNYLSSVEKIESDSDRQDLILTVHHCYMHALMNTPSFKMIENHNRAAFVKQIRHQVVAVPA